MVVHEIEPWGAAARAGLRSGDVITSWSRSAGAAEGGELRSPFELRLVEIEHSPHGPIELDVRRGRRRLRAVVESGEWELVTWPQQPPSEAARARETVQAESSEDHGAAVAIWEELAQRASDQDRDLDAAWYTMQGGIALIRAGDKAAAAIAFERARSRAGEALRVTLLEAEGDAWRKARYLDESLAAFRSALDVRRELEPESAGVGWSLYELARASFDNRDIAGRELGLASAEHYRGFPAAHLRLARSLNLVANFAYVTGALEEAEVLYREALAAAERVPGAGRTIADLYLNLGAVAHDHGRLREAEGFYRRTLAIEETLDPTGIGTAWVMNNLGILAKDTGDLEGARTYYRKALEIFSRERPGGVEEAGLLNNLGNVSQRQGDLGSAERFQRRALAIREALDSAATDVASSLHNLGSILVQRQRFDEARELLERSLAIKEELIPGTLLLANTLTELATLATESGRLDEAEALHTRALVIRRRVTESSSQVAMSVFGLGEVSYRAGRLAEAEARWREALTTIEAQRARWAAPSEQSYRFVAPFQRFYRRLAALLVETGREREAFELLEGARARALRVMMAQSGRRWRDKAIPIELAAERNRLAAALDRAMSRLERVNPELDPAGAEQLEAEVRDLRLNQDGLDARIRSAAPELARFEEPDPPDLDELRSVLDPGTLLLSFSVGDESTLLFAVAAGSDRGPPVTGFELRIGRAELSRRIEIFRALIERGRHTSAIESGLVSQGSRLFDLLLGPALETVERSDRLLLVLEGPLLTLPFGALVTATEPVRFLAESKPAFMSPSSAVFAALRESRRTTRTKPRFVAFGAPDAYQGSAIGGLPWTDLPHARQEVRRLAEVFDGRARVFVGDQATEAAVKLAGDQADYLHFATHAFADRRFPLDSGLVLASESAASEGESGILRASEIAADLRIGAELVTLSACDTAMGGELAGEGMIGLARAFQYAGARSLLVSQWPVSDRSTAELMVRFYRYLDAGRSKLKALQAARADLIAAPIESAGGEPIDARHPFHWAAFQLIGDWR